MHHKCIGNAFCCWRSLSEANCCWPLISNRGAQIDWKLEHIPHKPYKLCRIRYIFLFSVIPKMNKSERKNNLLTTEPTFKELLKGKRNDYGISQNRLAVIAGISHHQLSNIETGKVIPNKHLQDLLLTSLERLNPDSPLTMLFDYVRIRFPTLDVRFVIEDILQIKMKHLIHEDYGFYSYTEHYAIGDIFILTSPDENKGVLVELKGRGCRQFEAYLLGQNRSWYEFFNDCLIAKGIMKRLDLAINDKNGILNIPKLTAKCNNGECTSVFRSFKSYRSGELHKREEKDFMGYTLYIGSLQSEVYFCLYEKDYEQYIKNGIPIEESTVKNRFEIRLKNERASLAVEDLLKSQDVEHWTYVNTLDIKS